METNSISWEILLKSIRQTLSSEEEVIFQKWLARDIRHKEYYEKLVVNPGTNKLSQAALETLAIIAYNQPITTSEVSDVRGVQSGQLIRKLVAKGLLKEVGKSDMAGRPNLYATTSEFLDYFGLATLEDLPTVDVNNNSEDASETDLFTSIYKDEESI